MTVAPSSESEDRNAQFDGPPRVMRTRRPWSGGGRSPTVEPLPPSPVTLPLPLTN